VRCNDFFQELCLTCGLQKMCKQKLRIFHSYVTCSSVDCTVEQAVIHWCYKCVMCFGTTMCRFWSHSFVSRSRMSIGGLQHWYISHSLRQWLAKASVSVKRWPSSTVRSPWLIIVHGCRYCTATSLKTNNGCSCVWCPYNDCCCALH